MIPSTKYFRIVHNGKTLFLSASGKKTIKELGIRDGDEIIVGGVNAQKDTSDGLTITDFISTKSDASKSKKQKKSSLSTRKKGQKLAVPTLSPHEIEEKHRQSHSRAMTRVFEELNPLLKQIRTRLNDLTIHKPAPKARKSKSKKKKQPPLTSIMNLPTTDCLGGKAGKISYPVLVGEVISLYKTAKPNNKSAKSGRYPIVLDLHGLSKDEALKKLDECLPVWVETAMSGESPWVLPVDIICGGGSQILSEAVKDWIRSNRQVANRRSSR